MQTEAFKKWLEESGSTENARATRASCVGVIEKNLKDLGFEFDDLDRLIEAEGLDRLRARLKAMRADAKAGGQDYRILMPNSENPINRLSSWSSWVAQYAKFLSGVPPRLAQDADQIRNHVLETYITPARDAGEETVEVLVKDVNSDLGLNMGWPNICQALKKRKFLEMAALLPPEQIGADNSPATIFRFDLNRATPNDLKHPFVLYDAQGQPYQPVRNFNRTTGISVFNVKPKGASNLAEDALKVESIQEVARAMLIDNLASRIKAFSGGPVNYLTFGGSKLVRYELDPQIAAEIGVPPKGGEPPQQNRLDPSYTRAPFNAETEYRMPPTNLILYGPPGTGKTYRTAVKALELCGEDIPESRADLMAAYRRLQEAGQIEFVTFHQSMSYEDFIEGRQPVTDTEDDEDTTGAGFRLETRPGIFRRLAKRAETSRGKVTGAEALSLSGRQVFKMSLGGVHNPEDAPIFEEAIAGGYAVLSFDDIDWSDAKYENRDAMIEAVRQTGGENANADARSGAVQMPFIFRNWVRKGDIVIASKGNSLIRAIGEFTGDYEFHPRPEGDYAHRRSVRWLWVDRDGLPVSEIYPRNFTMKSIYALYDNDLNRPALERLMNSRGDDSPAAPEPFVLIIDEINRANISKVFGELITLLEPDKRLGQENELRLRLPYSGDEEFGVPSNLHIIGTMNTADRSIALLDTALRRRFIFEEMMPDADALQPAASLCDIDLPRLLVRLNARIEYLYDREHQIGHAYFITCKTRSDVDAVMRNKVIPLLAEYFFEDWGKVAAVLGDMAAGEQAFTGGFLRREVLSPPPGLEEDDAIARFRWSVKPSSFDYSGLLGQ